MLHRVKAVADRYETEIESGEKTMESVKFDQIGRELFSNVQPEEFQEMMQNMGQMFQSFGGGGGEGMPDFAALFQGMGRQETQSGN